MGEHITFIGLDVHKETITVALAETGVRGDVREYGRIANTPEALTRLVVKLKRTGGELRFCYVQVWAGRLFAPLRRRGHSKEGRDMCGRPAGFKWTAGRFGGGSTAVMCPAS
jgi:hypothetical protein